MQSPRFPAVLIVFLSEQGRHSSCEGKTSPWFGEKSSATLVNCLQPEWANEYVFGSDIQELLLHLWQWKKSRGKLDEMVQASSLFWQQWQRTLDSVLSWWSEPAELLDTLILNFTLQSALLKYSTFSRPIFNFALSCHTLLILSNYIKDITLASTWNRHHWLTFKLFSRRRKNIRAKAKNANKTSRIINPLFDGLARNTGQHLTRCSHFFHPQVAKYWPYYALNHRVRYIYIYILFHCAPRVLGLNQLNRAGVTTTR